MPTKVRPVTRQEILSLAVTDADAFTALRYLRHREAVPALPELEEKGASQFPGVEAALADCYYSLWDPEPKVKDEVSPDRRYWRQILDGALTSSAYQELHASTQLKELQSVLGTIAMGESVIAMVPKEDHQKLQELAEAQAEANEAGQQAQELQAQADAAGQMAEAMSQGQGQPQAGQGSPSGQSSPGSGGMTPDQAKTLANELAKQAVKAQADADAANQFAEEAKTKAEELVNELMGKAGSAEAQQKLDQLRRQGLAAAKVAQQKVEEVSETIESWGLEPAELTRQGIPEALGILERMKRNANLKKFAALLGRIRKIAARKARNKIKGDGARVPTIETGRDIKRADRSELVSLVHPALRVKALQRWTRGELRLHGQRIEQKLGHGPVVVCEDASGSMDGAKQQWAKAVVLSLAHYAKLQKRSFGWVMFDAYVQRNQTYPRGQMTSEQMLELVESRAGGGTDFEKPLRKALEMIQKEGLKKADVCFITDGECAVSDAFRAELRQIKKALEINIFTALCDVGSTSDSTVRSFSDRVEKVSAFTAEEAEAKLFSHF